MQLGGEKRMNLLLKAASTQMFNLGIVRGKKSVKDRIHEYLNPQLSEPSIKQSVMQT